MSVVQPSVEVRGWDEDIWMVSVVVVRDQSYL